MNSRWLIIKVFLTQYGTVYCHICIICQSPYITVVNLWTCIVFTCNIWSSWDGPTLPFQKHFNRIQLWGSGRKNRSMDPFYVAIVHIGAHSCWHGSFGCLHNNNCNNCKMIRKLVLAFQSCISRHNFVFFAIKIEMAFFFFDLKVSVFALWTHSSSNLSGITVWRLLRDIMVFDSF